MSGSSLIALCVLIGSVCAAHAQAPAAPRAIFSTTHRFVVQGLPQADAVVLARWAEDVASRLERVVGVNLPSLPGPPLELRSGASESSTERTVVRAQGYTDEGLSQKLLVDDMGAADQEDLLEGLCWLLVNRYLLARQEPGERQRQPAEAPDWLAVGLAQNLYAEQRERNAALTAARWRDGEGPGVDAMLALGYLPQGRWIEKSWCGMLIAWWIEQPDPRRRWDELFSHLARQGPVSDAGLAASLAVRTPREMEKGWDLWMARASGALRLQGGDAAERMRDLRLLMTVETERYGVSVTSKAPATVTFQELLTYRDEPWMVGLTGRLAYQLRWLAMGQSPEFQEVVRSYTVYLDALVGRQGSFSTGLFSDRPSSRQLRRWLEAADAALVQLETETQRRKDYVDAVEARLRAGPVEPIAPLDPARRRYLDDVERRLGPAQ